MGISLDGCTGLVKLSFVGQEPLYPENLMSFGGFLMQPLCAIEPMLVLEFSMLVLESCPSQTIDLFLSGNIPADLVNSYLKQHAPNMQAMYLELMLAMNEHGISGNLQNEMVNELLSHISFSYLKRMFNSDLSNLSSMCCQPCLPGKKKVDVSSG